MSFTGAFPANTIKLCSISPIKLRVSFYSKLLEQYLAVRGSISLVAMQAKLADACYLFPRYVVAVSEAVKITELYTANPVMVFSSQASLGVRDLATITPGLSSLFKPLVKASDVYLTQTGITLQSGLISGLSDLESAIPVYSLLSTILAKTLDSYSLNPRVESWIRVSVRIAELYLLSPSYASLLRVTTILREAILIPPFIYASVTASLRVIDLLFIAPPLILVAVIRSCLVDIMAIYPPVALLIVIVGKLREAIAEFPVYAIFMRVSAKTLDAFMIPPLLGLSINAGAKIRDVLSPIPPLMLFVELRAVLSELYGLKDPYLDWARSNWVNAVMSRSSIPLDYINQRLNLDAQPIDRATVNLGGNVIEASAVVLGVEAGARSYAIYFAIGLGTLYLTYQSYPLTITLHSGGSVVLVMSEQILFIGSEDRVYGSDVYTMVLHVRDDPVVVWTLDNRANALNYLTLNCSEGSYRLTDLKSAGSSLEYREGYLIVSNPPQCTNPVLRVYVSQFTPYTIEPGRIVFKVTA